MSALDGYAIRVQGDAVPGHYAAWLLAGLGAKVEVVGRRAPGALPPVSRWLTSGATYRVADDTTVAVLAGGVDALLVDVGDRLPPELPSEIARVAGQNPETVFSVVSPFGMTGPIAGRRATQHEVQAASGLLLVTGDLDAPPVPVGGDLIDMAIGANAALSVLLGLWRRRRAGHGAVADVSALETTIGLQSSRILTYAGCGLVFRRTKADSLGNFVPCKDGFVNIYLSYTPLDEYLRFLEVDGADWPVELFAIQDKGEQFAHPTLLAVTKQALQEKTRQEFVERGVWWRIPVTPALGPEDFPADPHLVERGYLKPLAPDGGGTGGGPIQAPAYPFKGAIWDTPERAEHLPAAGPGDVLLPLDGVRVAEFSLGWAAPMTGEILRMFGAEVLKVESPTRIDTSRVLPMLDLEVRAPWWEYSCNYHPVHAGKLHFGLDIKGPQGREALTRLLNATDLVVTNFSVRALRDLGLDGASVQAVNPRCSVVNATGYGMDGPYHTQGSYGSGMEGVTGLAWATGRPSGLIRSQLLHPDIFTALHAAVALVASLFRRERTGEGSVTDISQFELGALAVAGDLLEMQFLPAAKDSSPVRLRLGCAGEDEWVAATAGDEVEWQALLAVVGPTAEALRMDEARSDPEAAARQLSPLTATREKRELADSLQAAGLAAEPVLAYDEVCEHPHLAARNYLLRSENAAFGKRITVGRWHHFHDTDVASIDGVHRFGQDNQRVLTELLGFGDEEARRMVADGTVGLGPVDRPSPALPSSPIDWMLATRAIYRRNADFRERLGPD